MQVQYPSVDLSLVVVFYSPRKYKPQFPITVSKGSSHGNACDFRFVAFDVWIMFLVMYV